MFGKLLKYEFKSIGKWYFALNSAVILVSIVLGFAVKSLSLLTNDSNNAAQAILPVLLMMMLAVLIAGSWIATLVIIVRRFYKNIYGREGYLTLTLPVSTHLIILSKLVASVLWTIFNAIVVALGIMLIFLPNIGVGKMLVALPSLAQLVSPAFWLLGIAYLLASWVSSTLMIFLAISIGQLFSDKRILMGFVSYILLYILIVVISMFSTGAFNPLTDDDFPFTTPYFLYTIGECVVQALVFYWGTHYLLKNHLNIQ